MVYYFSEYYIFDVKSSDGTIGPLGSFGNDTAHEVIWITKYKTDAVNYGSAKITTVLDTLKSEIGRATFNNKFFDSILLCSKRVLTFIQSIGRL